LPDEFAEKGYIKSGILYYLDKKLKNKEIASFIISRTNNNSFRKIRDKHKITLNYDSLKWIKEHMATIIYESKIEKSNLANNWFAKTFPRHFKTSDASPRQRATKVIKNLDFDIIESFSKEETDKLMAFYEEFISKKYKSKIHRYKLFSSTKLKIDNIAINEIIGEFEKLLIKNVAESEWGKFLQKNLFLVDSKYVHVIPELNVVLAGSRKVDFGLVDSQGYMDIFEIKKSSTLLLSKNTDRGNYYWSTDAVKALVQAEKYLFNAERKAPALAEDINAEKKLNVEVVKPRAILILGNTGQLKNENMRRDFRVLRMSLKNIEVVLYDELLARLKSQKDKIYIDPQ